jgi:hypothetical protein
LTSPSQLPQLTVIEENEAGNLTIIIINILPEKQKLLKNQFFPQPKETDLTDIANYFYPKSLVTERIISEEEIYDAIHWVIRDKASEPDQISNRMLKAATV